MTYLFSINWHVCRSLFRYDQKNFHYIPPCFQQFLYFYTFFLSNLNRNVHLEIADDILDQLHTVLIQCCSVLLEFSQAPVNHIFRKPTICSKCVKCLCNRKVKSIKWEYQIKRLKFQVALKTTKNCVKLLMLYFGALPLPLSSCNVAQIVFE